MSKKKLPPLLNQNQLEKVLRKIKRPVFIRCFNWFESPTRTRVLYPNGRCEFSLKFELTYSKSCFSSKGLNSTINGMLKFDEHSFLYEVVRL